jgi:predicted transcriptional regulator with HTH domain
LSIVWNRENALIEDYFMLSKLLVSASRKKILFYFIENPLLKIHLQEIVRILKLDPHQVV